LRACLVASWNLGALPPVLLRAVRLVRAMVVVVVVLLLGGVVINCRCVLWCAYRVPRIMLEDQQRILTGRQTDPIVAWPLTNTFTNTYHSHSVPSMNGIVGSGAGRSWVAMATGGIDSGCTLVLSLLAAAESIEREADPQSPKPGGIEPPHSNKVIGESKKDARKGGCKKRKKRTPRRCICDTDWCKAAILKKPNFLLTIQKTKTIADEKWLGYWNDVCSALGLPQKDRPSRRWFISQYHFHPEERAKWDYTNKALANLSMPMKIERCAPFVLELGLCGRKKRAFVTAERYMCICGTKGCKDVSLKKQNLLSICKTSYVTGMMYAPQWGSHRKT
jgi:hypothetical protein